MKTYLFDFDGTLVDSMPTFGKMMKRILDDNFNALTTAKSAGMSVYGVYDKSSDEYTEDIKAISDRYISDFKELI